jgi:hypothetical protein
LRDGRKPIYFDISLQRRSQIVVPYVMYMVVDAYNTPDRVMILYSHIPDAFIEGIDLAFLTG